MKSRKMTKNETIALFDMDGTICDYVGAIKAELEKLKSPNEDFIDPFTIKDSSDYQYLWNRMDLIKADENWWANMPKFKLGLDILEVTIELGFYNEILTQAPKSNPAALAGKLKWIQKNIEGEIDFTMTRNKSRHYGKVLVDDFPGFILSWLKHRPRGLAIMPLNEYNKDFSHQQVIVYDGTNLNDIKKALINLRDMQ